jgi:hypothetical protein
MGGPAAAAPHGESNASGSDAGHNKLWIGAAGLVVAAVAGGTWQYLKPAPVAVTAVDQPSDTARKPIQGPLPDKPVVNTVADLETAPTTADDDRSFFNSRYTYCDAKLLAGVWRIKDIGESKSRLGRLIRLQEHALIQTRLGQAYAAANNGSGVRCTWDDGGYSPVDASKLAKVWRLSLTETKARIEVKINNGLNEIVQSALRGA